MYTAPCMIPRTSLCEPMSLAGRCRLSRLSRLLACKHLSRLSLSPLVSGLSLSLNGFVCLVVVHTYKPLAHSVSLKRHPSIDFGHDSVIFSNNNIVPCTVSGPPLSENNGSVLCNLTIMELYSQALRVR